MDTSFEAKKRHHGYNIKRLREILGVKQEDLAERMELSQQTISRFEQRDTLENDILEKVAKALNIPIEAIKEYSDDAAINIISNVFTSNDNSTLNAVNNQCTFNPLDKIIELYERMLKAEQEKVALLEEILKGKK